MLPLGGAITLNAPDPAVNDIPTRRWSKSNEWVEEPGRTNTACEIFAASGVETVNNPPHVMFRGALEMPGLLAGLPSELKRYAGL